MQKHKSETYIANDEQRDQFEDSQSEWEKGQINSSFKADAMQECLMHLTEDQREVLYLYFNDEKSYEEIANVI